MLFKKKKKHTIVVYCDDIYFYLYIINLDILRFVIIKISISIYTKYFSNNRKLKKKLFIQPRAQISFNP